MVLSDFRHDHKNMVAAHRHNLNFDGGGIPTKTTDTTLFLWW
jgi:hypothetical protein